MEAAAGGKLQLPDQTSQHWQARHTTTFLQAGPAGRDICELSQLWTAAGAFNAVAGYLDTLVGSGHTTDIVTATQPASVELATKGADVGHAVHTHPAMLVACELKGDSPRGFLFQLISSPN